MCRNAYDLIEKYIIIPRLPSFGERWHIINKRIKESIKSSRETFFVGNGPNELLHRLTSLGVSQSPNEIERDKENNDNTTKESLSPVITEQDIDWYYTTLERTKRLLTPWFGTGRTWTYDTIEHFTKILVCSLELIRRSQTSNDCNNDDGGINDDNSNHNHLHSVNYTTYQQLLSTSTSPPPQQQESAVQRYHAFVPQITKESCDQILVDVWCIVFVYQLLVKRNRLAEISSFMHGSNKSHTYKLVYRFTHKPLSNYSHLHRQQRQQRQQQHYYMNNGVRGTLPQHSLSYYKEAPLSIVPRWYSDEFYFAVKNVEHLHLDDTTSSNIFVATTTINSLQSSSSSSSSSSSPLNYVQQQAMDAISEWNNTTPMGSIKPPDIVFRVIPSEIEIQPDVEDYVNFSDTNVDILSHSTNYSGTRFELRSNQVQLEKRDIAPISYLVYENNFYSPQRYYVGSVLKLSDLYIYCTNLNIFDDKGRLSPILTPDPNHQRSLSEVLQHLFEDSENKSINKGDNNGFFTMPQTPLTTAAAAAPVIMWNIAYDNDDNDDYDDYDKNYNDNGGGGDDGDSDSGMGDSKINIQDIDQFVTPLLVRDRATTPSQKQQQQQQQTVLPKQTYIDWESLHSDNFTVVGGDGKNRTTGSCSRCNNNNNNSSSRNNSRNNDKNNENIIDTVIYDTSITTELNCVLLYNPRYIIQHYGVVVLVNLFSKLIQSYTSIWNTTYSQLYGLLATVNMVGGSPYLNVEVPDPQLPTVIEWSVESRLLPFLYSNDVPYNIVDSLSTHPSNVDTIIPLERQQHIEKIENGFKYALHQIESRYTAIANKVSQHLSSSSSRSSQYTVLTASQETTLRNLFYMTLGLAIIPDLRGTIRPTGVRMGENEKGVRFNIVTLYNKPLIYGMGYSKVWKIFWASDNIVVESSHNTTNYNNNSDINSRYDGSNDLSGLNNNNSNNNNNNSNANNADFTTTTHYSSGISESHRAFERNINQSIQQHIEWNVLNFITVSIDSELARFLQFHNITNDGGGDGDRDDSISPPMVIANNVLNPSIKSQLFVCLDGKHIDGNNGGGGDDNEHIIRRISHIPRQALEIIMHYNLFDENEGGRNPFTTPESEPTHKIAASDQII
jgi:hypothetical protein